MVPCLDGTKREVYKNIRDAFPEPYRESITKAKGAMKALEGLEAQASADVQRQVKTVHATLDQANNSLYQNYACAYVVFKADPCTMTEYLAEAVARIQRGEERLRHLMVIGAQLIGLLETKAPATAIVQCCAAFLEASRPSYLADADAQLKEAPARIVRWKKP